MFAWVLDFKAVVTVVMYVFHGARLHVVYNFFSCYCYPIGSLLKYWQMVTCNDYYEVKTHWWLTHVTIIQQISWKSLLVVSPIKLKFNPEWKLNNEILLIFQDVQMLKWIPYCYYVTIFFSFLSELRGLHCTSWFDRVSIVGLQL